MMKFKPAGNASLVQECIDGIACALLVPALGYWLDAYQMEQPEDWITAIRADIDFETRMFAASILWRWMDKHGSCQSSIFVQWILSLNGEISDKTAFHLGYTVGQEACGLGPSMYTWPSKWKSKSKIPPVLFQVLPSKNFENKGEYTLYWASFEE